MGRTSVGRICGETGFSSFKFEVTDTSLERMEYVKAWHESDNWILAQVLDIKKKNPSTKEKKEFDQSKEKVIAKADIIGYRDNRGLLRSPKTPLSPGDEVFKSDKDLIENTLGIDRGHVFLGKLDGSDLGVKLDANELVQKHCSILARTGSGKSYTCGVVIEELLEDNVPVVIIDPHGEFHSLKKPNQSKKQKERMDEFGIKPKGFSSQVNVFSPDPSFGKHLKLDGSNLEAREIMNLLPTSPTNTQQGILYQAIKDLKKREDDYSLKGILRTVKSSERQAKWNLINQLELIHDLDIFSDEPTPIDSLVNEGEASVINLKGVRPEIQELVAARICSDLFRARKLENVPPAMLVVEESHTFAPERGFKKSISSDIMRTIASEGRKFGLGLTVVSQRPARVDKNVLSQCNTQVILKVTNPNDLNAIKKGVEGLNSEMQDEIKSLPTGVALLVSNDIEKPVFVDVRVRKTSHGGEAVQVINKKQSSGRKKEAGMSKGKFEGDDESSGGMIDKIFGK
ncbi:ATPase [archaeon SCG-AAA382B04]|nr:ATPase [archaeon SCG-AAA382B04]